SSVFSPGQPYLPTPAWYSDYEGKYDFKGNSPWGGSSPFPGGPEPTGPELSSDNPNNGRSTRENSTISSERYSLFVADRYIYNEIKIAEWLNPLGSFSKSTDFIDREKIGFGPATCDRTEWTASEAQGAFTVNKGGPIRVIRGTIGFNSGNLTERIDTFYRYSIETEFILRIHSLTQSPSLGWDFDSSVSGITYDSNLLTVPPVTIDGASDGAGTRGSPYAQGTAGLEWEHFRNVYTTPGSPGESGWEVVRLYELYTDHFGTQDLDGAKIDLELRPIYEDIGPAPAYCTGDWEQTGPNVAGSYGESGARIGRKFNSSGNPGTDMIGGLSTTNPNANAPGGPTQDLCGNDGINDYFRISLKRTTAFAKPSEGDHYRNVFSTNTDGTPVSLGVNYISGGPPCGPPNSAGGGANSRVAPAEAGLSVYPNPSTGSATVMARFAEPGAEVQIAVYDMLGRLVIQQTATVSKAAAGVQVGSLDSLSAASYVVVVRSGGEEQRQMLTVTE
ncbi:MAG: T9SS type A sorting domain-containing protein, partial [Bacteroidota bacterium]